MKKKLVYCALLVLLVLFFDQFLKIWIKVNFEYREDRVVFGDWFRLHFIENNGFAFGTELGGRWGKLALTLFRLVAVGVIGFYIVSLIKMKEKTYRLGYILMVSLIMAGALGNIIDSVFYGVIFSASPAHGGGLAMLFPPEGGYESLFHGKVVDMLYFPLYQGFLPEWIPFLGGDYFEFFRPVFNIADSAISLGVAGILLFYRKELKLASSSSTEKVVGSSVEDATDTDPVSEESEEPEEENAA